MDDQKDLVLYTTQQLADYFGVQYLSMRRKLAQVGAKPSGNVKNALGYDSHVLELLEDWSPQKRSKAIKSGLQNHVLSQDITNEIKQLNAKLDFLAGENQQLEQRIDAFEVWQDQAKGIIKAMGKELSRFKAVKAAEEG